MAKSDIDKLLDEKKATNDEEIGAEKWDPKDGEKVDGAIQKVGWYDGGDYEAQLYLIFKLFDSDETIRIYCKTVLLNQLVEEKPAVGQHMVIRYDGKVQGAKRKYHGFTTILVPDDGGNVKRDPKFWAENGTYRGAKTTTPQREEPDGGFF
jgi:hypothetical protein